LRPRQAALRRRAASNEEPFDGGADSRRCRHLQRRRQLRLGRHRAGIAPAASDPTVKARADKFLGTDLEKILKDKGIKTVIVAGTAGNGAVLYTASEAAMRGFNVIVPVDGLPSSTAYAEQFTVWQLANGPGFAKQVTITRSDMIKF
jgi:nicotinamidase-related amidase